MPVLSTVGAMSARGFGWLFKAAAPITKGSLWSWGFNENGQLGLGDIIDRSSPVQVGTATDWSLVGAFNVQCTSMGALRAGALYMWGRGSGGILGTGNTTSQSSPVQVGALTTWATIAGSQTTAFAIRTDGTFWRWGNPQAGEGGSTGFFSSSPVQLGSLTDWKYPYPGFRFILATKTDGTLWAWGSNANGELGLNDTTNRDSPVQVGTLTTWSSASAGGDAGASSASYAIKTDGTLWAWGSNLYGRLGLNDTVNRSSPVQVGSLTSWKSVSAGGYHTHAIRTNGTLWSWGFGVFGALGNGFTTDRSSPVQVGALTTWAAVSAGLYAGFAVKTDGTLWVWGYNGLGGLGTNDTTNYSSPVQVGTATNWLSAVMSDGYSGFAIRS